MRIALAIIFFLGQTGLAQNLPQPDAATIKLELKKLNSLGSVLYVAAHPDDENTRAIAYLVNDRLVSTAYLSLTRGDGGQNLIGPEIRDLLGLIRTQELLAARRIDHGQQYFTRANDFGYSKTAKETFSIWNKKEILSDVIRVIRQFKPDVILTRFPPDERAGHGQHTASAMLAIEAFDLTGDPGINPEQVKEFGTWQAKRLLINTGRWWNQSIDEKTPGVLTMNVGAYSALLGKSSSEIAAESRTQHKSQGFGSPGRRGDAPEYFEQVKGEIAQKDIFEGVNTTWTRIKGGGVVQVMVDKAIKEFNEENPSASVPQLLQIRREILLLEENIWKSRKLADINRLIQACLGLFIETTSDFYWTTPGGRVQTGYEILNRSAGAVKLLSVHSSDLGLDTLMNTDLRENIPLIFKTSRLVDEGKPYSDPYWLKEPHSQGEFTVSQKELIGKPESDPAVQFRFTFSVYGETISFDRPLIYKWTDPVKGELSRPFQIVPPLFVNLSSKVYMFPDVTAKDISVVIKSASTSKLEGSLRLSLPEGWKSEPAATAFSLGQRGEEKIISFKVTPGVADVTSNILALARVGAQEYDQSLTIVDYDHIPVQLVLPKAEAKAVRLNMRKEGEVVGYIRGAGDEIPAGLRNMGYQVWEMKDEEVTPENLRKMDAVVLGIRALNTNDRIRHYMSDLQEYVKQGGTVIVQYNNSNALEIEAGKIAPYPISLSRDRVTEENSEVKILKPDHPAMNYPNRISAKDFEGWVQERGLNFPNQWDSHFEALISMHDDGETAKEGALLVADYGKGHFVYTGLSFFRELPEGVPGAYRLFANLVSMRGVHRPVNVEVRSKAK